MPKLSLNEMTTYRWSFDEDVTNYRELGIEGIGVWRRKVNEFGEERAGELIQDSGLKVSAVLWGGGFTGADGRSYKESVEDAVEGIQTAGQLGAEVFVVVSGPRGGHTHNHARALIVDALAELAPVAQESGVALGLEPMHAMFAKEWTFLSNLDDTLAVLDRVEHDSVGLVFDTYHLWCEERVVERIGEIAPRVRLVQLADWHDPPRSDNDRVLPGTGCAAVREMVQAFAEAGYDGFYDIEILSDELWHSDYRQLVQDCRQSFETLWQ
jgi:sugar phosphate isomerase/epimerase